MERVEEKDKIKIQFFLPEWVIVSIRIRAANLEKTQSKYIMDLVLADLGVDSDGKSVV